MPRASRSARRGASRAAVTAGLCLLTLLVPAVDAGAELVLFATGRTLSVAGHRVEGEAVVLLLKNGGEMTLPATMLAGFAPDEVLPEPVAPASSTPPDGSMPPAASRPSPGLIHHPEFDPLIRRAAAAHGVDVALVRAVVQVESGYRPRARSSKGAVGLMQVTPATARRYGRGNLHDPATNVQVGTRHLRTLLDRFPLALALAAYNAGEAAVERFGGVPPYPETIAYVGAIERLLGR